MSVEIDDRFRQLFSGNITAYGEDWGESVLAPPPWESHMHGTKPIGIYPMFPTHGGEPSWRVHWGCVDLDVKRDGKRRWDYDTEQDADTAARNLVAVLEAFKVVSWIEVTKSHGRHVWVFAEEPLPAATMRRALLVACEIAGVPPTEVNPKAEAFDDPATLGNYVRLPYPNGCPNDRYMVNTAGEKYERNGWINAAWALRTTEDNLSVMADLYVPPAPRITLLDGEYDGQLNDDVTPYIRKVLESGPIEGRDRSGWLWWLAGKCVAEGLTPECALAVLTTADDTWTRKYTTRKDGERRLAELIEKVYQ